MKLTILLGLNLQPHDPEVLSTQNQHQKAKIYTTIFCRGNLYRLLIQHQTICTLSSMSSGYPGYPGYQPEQDSGGNSEHRQFHASAHQHRPEFQGSGVAMPVSPVSSGSMRSASSASGQASYNQYNAMSNHSSLSRGSTRSHYVPSTEADPNEASAGGSHDFPLGTSLLPGPQRRDKGPDTAAMATSRKMPVIAMRARLREL